MKTIDNHPSVKPEAGRTGGSMLLYKTQTRFYPFDPRPEEIHIADIAFNLSRLPRWLGGGRYPYSIAQHSLLVAALVHDRLNTHLTGVTKEGRLLIAKGRLAGLLHDAEEAYMNDLPSPVKHDRTLWGFVDASDNISEMICEKYLHWKKLPLGIRLTVEWADQVAAAMEMKQLISASRELPSWWPPEYAKLKLPDWHITESANQERDEAKFYKLYEELCVKIGENL